MQTIWCGFPALHRCAPQRISGLSFPALSASNHASLESPRRSAHTASASHWPPASARGCCSLCWSAPMHSALPAHSGRALARSSQAASPPWCALQDALNYGDHDGAANIEVRLAEDGSFVAVAKRAIQQGEEVRLCKR